MACILSLFTAKEIKPEAYKLDSMYADAKTPLNLYVLQMKPVSKLDKAYSTAQEWYGKCGTPWALYPIRG